MTLSAQNLSRKPNEDSMDELERILPRTAELRDGRLFIGGVDMVELAHEQGTALYVYDEDDLRWRMRSYREAFSRRYERSEIIFAGKAFVNKALLLVIEDEGLSLDVSGGGELAFAAAAKFPMEKVYVHGNNKTPRELEEAIGAGVGRIVIDSLEELARVSEIASKHKKVQEIYVRITPGVEADTHAYIQTGCEDSKFGFNLQNGQADEAVAKVLGTPHVRLAGFHTHIGSQIFLLDSYQTAIHAMVCFMARVKTEHKYIVEELDVGGGLGFAYTAGDRPSSIDEFAETVTSALYESCAEFDFELPRLLCEPGRSLAANAGVTLYTIGTIKKLPGVRTYVSIDGGMSDNIRPALYEAKYEALIANKAGQARTETVTLSGKHCESGDKIIIDAALQEPEVGDVVCVFATGAYGHTMASNYNGQPRPAIVFVKDGASRVVTRRETYEDLLIRELV